MGAGRGPAPVRRNGWRTAPAAFALALVSGPVAGWFAIWGLDNVNHCDDAWPERDCGLGFAVLIPLAWLVTLVLAAIVFGLGFARLRRGVAWTICLVAVAAMWAVNLGALASYRPR